MNVSNEYNSRWLAKRRTGFFRSVIDCNRSIAFVNEETGDRIRLQTNGSLAVENAWQSDRIRSAVSSISVQRANRVVNRRLKTFLQRFKRRWISGIIHNTSIVVVEKVV